MDAAEKRSRGRTHRLRWSDKLTSEVKGPRSGARTRQARAPTGRREHHAWQMAGSNTTPGSYWPNDLTPPHTP
ncbi:hypothetical protein JOE09_001740 [Pantoea coffeiphila]|nr:hypothetical protein [Pantoea coffeiphila]